MIKSCKFNDVDGEVKYLYKMFNIVKLFNGFSIFDYIFYVGKDKGKFKGK